MTLLGQGLFGDALRQVDRLLPHRDEGLRHLAGQCRQAGLAAQAVGQACPPLIEQPADPRRAATAQLQTHTLDRGPLTARQHRIRGGKYLVFRHPYRHGPPPAILGLIKEVYPTL
ncbi:hypothetical protein D3C81_1903840 [compost metagenome]